MGDWPTKYFALPAGTINPFSPCCLVHTLTSGASFTTATAWPAANRAIYLPFFLEQTVTAYHIGVSVSTQSGNLDVGIYDDYGARLVSSGSTAMAVAGVQRFNIADTVLTPGVYYMAIAVDNTTAVISSVVRGDTLLMDVTGLRTQNLASVTLPNPATFAAPASTLIPLVAVALNPTL